MVASSKECACFVPWASSVLSSRLSQQSNSRPLHARLAFPIQYRVSERERERRKKIADPSFFPDCEKHSNESGRSVRRSLFGRVGKNVRRTVKRETWWSSPSSFLLRRSNTWKVKTEMLLFLLKPTRSSSPFMPQNWTSILLFALYPIQCNALYYSLLLLIDHHITWCTEWS